jgi:hypothetical protein
LGLLDVSPLSLHDPERQGVNQGYQEAMGLGKPKVQHNSQHNGAFANGLIRVSP